MQVKQNSWEQESIVALDRLEMSPKQIEQVERIGGDFFLGFSTLEIGLLVFDILLSLSNYTILD